MALNSRNKLEPCELLAKNKRNKGYISLVTLFSIIFFLNKLTRGFRALNILIYL